jgi:hypothetical protein
VVFPRLKPDLAGNTYDKEEEIKVSVKAYFTNQDESFYRKSFTTRILRCSLCAIFRGDYVEK